MFHIFSAIGSFTLGDGVNEKRIFTVCVLAISLAMSSQAQTLTDNASPSGAAAGLKTVTLPAVADTYLRQSAPNSSHGPDPLLRVKRSERTRALVRFDQAALASALSGATLRSARLEMYVQALDGTRGGSRSVGVHRLNAAWTESGATWSCAADSKPANARPDCFQRWDGGTFTPTPTANVLHANGTRGWVAFDVTSDVAAFLKGAAPHHGWLLQISSKEQQGWVEYRAREAGAALAPRLVVSFESQDTTPPVISGLTPADLSVLSRATPMIGADFSDQQSGVEPASVRLLVDDEDRTAEVQVSAAGVRFLPPQPLAEGVHSAFVSVRDRAGQYASASWLFTIDTQPPSLTIAEPSPDQLINSGTTRVAGTVVDDNGIASLRVNGTLVPVTENRFEIEHALKEGDNPIRVEAVDPAGNRTEASVVAVRFSLPVVTITTPQDLSLVAATTIRVSGTVGDPTSTVQVNGIPASVSGTTFVATGVPLIEGGNILTATAQNAQGHVGTDSVSIVRDLTPPRLVVGYPKAGSSTSEATVTVTGLVNDIVVGTVNAPDVAVTVNGRPAEVANRSFKVEGVPLVEGDNILTVVAVDESGNRAEIQSMVRREAPGRRRLVIISGNNQIGRIDQPLPQPLRVALLDATGVPVAGKPVLFKVVGNNGYLSGGKRQIAVTTDVQGQAEASFHLGTRAGVGHQVVEALVPGFEGPAVFTASALPTEPVLIVVDSGDQQVGIAGRPLPRPLVAAVTDAGYNRLEGVPVKFSVVTGGHFENGLNEMTVVTDSDGRAIVSWTLDSDEGVAHNVVKAAIASLPDGPDASFTATGRAAGNPAQTTISGVVLDNSNLPIAGVTLRIRDTNLMAETDESGLFHISSAPVGTVRLIVDGSTAHRPGSWPDLEFVLTTIPGRDNTVEMPIYLLPLDLQSGLLVDETRGGTLTLPDFPGFSLEVAPGSVTFPGGGRSGVISVTRVNSDKVPMVPNFGQQPRFIVTIQPAGARFDPPARLTLPNVEGLERGQVTELYSFDHDLGHFVSIGPATVSEDGSTIVSNPGVGILKAGWHCGGDPASSGTPENCKACEICIDDSCRPDPEAICKPCDIGKACNGQGNCLPGRSLITSICGRYGFGLVIANRRPLPLDDPIVKAKTPCTPDDCYAGKIEDLLEITHSCDGIALTGSRLTEEISWTSTNGCPSFSGGAGKGCIVGPGNRLVKQTDEGLAPCEDRQLVCPRPDQLSFASGICTITLHQKIMLEGCVVKERKTIFTLSKSPDGACSAVVN